MYKDKEVEDVLLYILDMELRFEELRDLCEEVLDIDEDIELK